MTAGLSQAGRIVALLSPAYLASDYARVEWMSALADDPLNRSGRLIPLRIAPCEPEGLLGTLAYVDLVPSLDDPERFADTIRSAFQKVASMASDHGPGPLDHQRPCSIPKFANCVALSPGTTNSWRSRTHCAAPNPTLRWPLSLSLEWLELANPSSLGNMLGSFRRLFRCVVVARLRETIPDR